MRKVHAVADMKRAAIAHMETELAGDVDIVMATVAPNPVWDIYPIFRAVGFEAVREMYRRVVPVPLGREILEEMTRGTDDSDITAWGHNWCIMDFPVNKKKYPLLSCLIQVYVFEGNLVSSERVYMIGPDSIRAPVDKLGQDFFNLPGVTRY